VDTTDLNDILLRVSAFGLFVYATFSVIAGAKSALTEQKNLLVLISGSITIIQVWRDSFLVAVIITSDPVRKHSVGRGREKGHLRKQELVVKGLRD